jgi:hypothetical protein
LVAAHRHGGLLCAIAAKTAPNRARHTDTTTLRLPATSRVSILPGMFAVTEAEAAAIRAVFKQHGEFAAAIELRRLFPGVTDNEQARECARAIAGWKPLPVPRRSRTRRKIRAGDDW